MSYRSRYGRRRSGYSARRGAQGQGGMRALNSGVIPLVRHSVNVTPASSGYQNAELEDGKAMALPLVCYYGTTGGSGGVSSAPTTREGSRVNHISTNLSITQADTSKPNQVYVGLISVSFSDAMLNAANMTSNFADLIKTDNATEGYMAVSSLGQKDLTYTDWSQSATLRHWIRGFQQNTYTLYSGRPAVNNSVIPLPRKNKRQQFGSGFYMVVMNDSGDLQNVASGSGTSVNVSLKTFFKEVPEPDVTVT